MRETFFIGLKIYFHAYLPKDHRLRRPCKFINEMHEEKFFIYSLIIHVRRCTVLAYNFRFKNQFMLAVFCLIIIDMHTPLFLISQLDAIDFWKSMEHNFYIEKKPRGRMKRSGKFYYKSRKYMSKV